MGLALLNSSSVNMVQKKIPLDMPMFSGTQNTEISGGILIQGLYLSPLRMTIWAGFKSTESNFALHIFFVPRVGLNVS